MQQRIASGLVLIIWENYTSADLIPLLCEAIKSHNNKAVIKLLETKKNDKSAGIPYMASAIVEDIGYLNQYRESNNLSDDDLAIAIVSFMFHLSEKSAHKVLIEAGYSNVTNLQIRKTFSTLVTLRSLNEFW